MRIIVPKYRMNIHARRNDRCADLSQPDRHSDFWLFTAMLTISFASAGIYLVRPIIGC